MKKKTLIKIFIGILGVFVLLLLLAKLFLEPWVEKKIQTALQDQKGKYKIEIEDIDVSIFSRGAEFKTIIINDNDSSGLSGDLHGEIASIQCKGVNLRKILFNKDLSLNEIVISNSSIVAAIQFPSDSMSPVPPIISALNFQVNKVSIDHLALFIKDVASSKSYASHHVELKVYDLELQEADTLSAGIIKEFDLDAIDFASTSADSMYQLFAKGVHYAADAKTLSMDSFMIHPTYEDYAFTDLHPYQVSRIEAEFSKIFVHDFSAADLIRSGAIASSFIEIGEMEMEIFKDRRKPFHHILKPQFPDLLYNYRGLINIDSIGLLNGKVTYAEHDENAAQPGSVHFDQIHSTFYKITNDSIYKTEEAFLVIKTNALFMGTGKLNFLMKSRLFDDEYLFTMNGSVAEMQAQELNPVLEYTAFMTATTGRISSMHFNFTANTNHSNGEMIFLYDGLSIEVKNDEAGALKGKVLSIIANMALMDSNPLPGDQVRTGIIDFERDPEKSIFNYCFKSVLSGVKSTLSKKPLLE